MKVLIAATPLESLTWNSTTNKVKIRFREGTDLDTQQKFLESLQHAVAVKLHKVDREVGKNV